MVPLNASINVTNFVKCVKLLNNNNIIIIHVYFHYIDINESRIESRRVKIPAIKFTNRKYPKFSGIGQDPCHRV